MTTGAAPLTVVVAGGIIFLSFVLLFTRARDWLSDQTTVNRATLHLAPLVVVWMLVVFRAWSQTLRGPETPLALRAASLPGLLDHLGLVSAEPAVFPLAPDSRGVPGHLALVVTSSHRFAREARARTGACRASPHNITSDFSIAYAGPEEGL